jgi:hypothetical protein
VPGTCRCQQRLTLRANLILPAGDERIALAGPLGRVVAFDEDDVLEADGGFGQLDLGDDRDTVSYVVVVALEGSAEDVIDPGLGGSQILGALDDGDAANLERRAFLREANLHRQALVLLHLDVMGEGDADGVLALRRQPAGGAARLGVLGDVLVELGPVLKGAILAVELRQAAQRGVRVPDAAGLAMTISPW